jgi:hypothetical protein
MVKSSRAARTSADPASTPARVGADFVCPPTAQQEDSEMALTKTSEKKRAANARNAQRSTGPKTAEGKARSSRNAITHGLCSNHLHRPMRNETADHFQDTVEELIGSWEPANDQEVQLVKGIAIAWMRIERSERWESATLSGVINTRERVLGRKLKLNDEYGRSPVLDEDLGCVIAMTDKEGDRMWEKVQRHSAKAWRDWNKAIDTLRKMQNSRKREDAQHQQEMSAAAATAALGADRAPQQSQREEAVKAAPLIATNAAKSTDLGSFCNSGTQHPPHLQHSVKARKTVGRTDQKS